MKKILLVLVATFFFITFIENIDAESDMESSNTLANKATPIILYARVEPDKVVPGDIMTVTVETFGATKIIAEMPHEKGSDMLTLMLTGGSVYYGVWESEWTVHDTIMKNYTSVITATNVFGKKVSIDIIWEDAITYAYKRKDADKCDFYVYSCVMPCDPCLEGPTSSNCAAGTYYTGSTSCSQANPSSCSAGYCKTCGDCSSGACTDKTTTSGDEGYGCTGACKYCSSGTCADVACAHDTIDTTCTGSNYCNAGSCVSTLATGESCCGNDACQSDICCGNGKCKGDCCSDGDCSGSDLCNTTNMYCYTPNAPPQNSTSGTNTTAAGISCLFYEKWYDLEGNLSHYIFSTNNTGTWTNESTIAFTQVNNSWVNITKALNNTNNLVVGWKVYANDTGNAWNTSTHYLTTIAIPPSINQIQCAVNTDTNWTDCNTAMWGTVIKQIRVNCTAGLYYPIESVNYNLTNIPDSYQHINEANATSASGDWWILNNADLTIYDSGTWNLTVICTDSFSSTDESFSNWTVNWGHIEPYLIGYIVNANMDVNQKEFFTFGLGLTCIGGECGDVGITLDPESGNISLPEIKGAYVVPEDVFPGDIMEVNAIIVDEAGIESVIAEMPHEKGSDLLNLYLKEGNKFSGIWQNTWLVHDTRVKQYKTRITATNIFGLSSTKNIFWTDADTSYTQSCGSNGSCSCKDMTECVLDTDCLTSTCGYSCPSANAHSALSGNSCSAQANHNCHCILVEPPTKLCIEGQCSCTVSGSCTYTCDSGWYNDDDDENNGCENAQPTINILKTDPPTPYYGNRVGCIADVTDDNDDLAWVNFTIISGNGSIIDTGYISHSGNIWTVYFDIDAYGTWNCSVVAGDSYGRVDSEYILRPITEKTGTIPSYIVVREGEAWTDMNGVQNEGLETDPNLDNASNDTHVAYFNATGDWVSWDIGILTADTYNIWFRYATYETGTIIHDLYIGDSLEFDDITFTGTGGAATYEWKNIGAKELSMGTNKLNMTYEDNWINIDLLLLTNTSSVPSGIVGESPFYTIDPNPQTCSAMKHGNTCNKTWHVNATGEDGTMWRFFGVYNATNYTSYVSSNVTGKTNITIVVPTCTLSFNPVSPQTYPTEFKAICGCTGSKTSHLYRNGTDVTTAENNTNVLLGAATHSYICNISTSIVYPSDEDTADYIINQNSTNPINIYFTNTTSSYQNQNVTVTYSESTTANATMVYTSSGSASLYRNGASVSNPETITLGAGTHSYKGNTTGNANYTANATGATFYIIVNQATSSCSLSFNPASPQTHPTPITATCGCTGDGTATLYRNGTDVTTAENNTAITLGAATHSYICNITSTTNYTSATDSANYIINQNSTNPVDIYLQNSTNTYKNQNITVQYGQWTNANSTLTYSNAGSALLYRDGISKSNPENITLGVGTYAYKGNTTGNVNYTTNATGSTFYVIVTKASGSCTLSSSSGWSYSYGPSTTLTCSCVGDGTAHLYFDGTEQDGYNNTAVTFAADEAGYSVICNMTEGTNYTSATDSNTLTIQKQGCDINLWLNSGTKDADNSITYPTQANATAVVNNSQSFNLERNSSSVDSGAGTLSEIITLSVAVYNYTAHYAATQNYSACTETSHLTVSQGTLNVTITAPTNGSSYDRGATVTLTALIQDQNGDSVSGATVEWYNSTHNIDSGASGSWVIPINYAIGTETIKCNATKGNYSTGDDSVTINIQNAEPTVGEPTYNVTPARIFRGDGIEISCNITDVEDAAGDLTVNISIKDPNNSWSNTSADGNIGDTFYRNYGTDDSSPIGTYTAVCTALDSDNGFASGSTSTFIIYMNGTITVNLNSTSVWWGEGVNIYGQANRSTGEPIALTDVNITVGPYSVCSGTSTNANGAYTCDFSAPNAIGNYTVTVRTVDAETDTIISNSTVTLNVEASFGDSKNQRDAADNVGCYEVPQIMQNPDGTVKKVIVRICVWK